MSKRNARRRSRLIGLLGAGLSIFAAGCSGEPAIPDPGLSWSLAQTRAQRIRGPSYRLHLDIPGDPGQPIRGRQLIGFDYRHSDSGSEFLVIDFEPGAEAVRKLAVNGRTLEVSAANGHLLIGEWEIPPGQRTEIELEFLAGEAPLNRREDFLYSLFVPDRASKAIPCFDQPDLKAVFELELAIPAGWNAVSNGALSEDTTGNGRRHLRFAPTRPISSYLFAFAAGRFQVEEGRAGERPLRFFHRETDQQKVERNRQALFDLHGQALEWLEEYTAIDYPFEKFDFVLIPAFQFGGMEHPGAVFYRAERLLLEESPTRNEVLGRASLIAHETAHMWFGDLVTMRWFDDVWTKEVYANFMAAKLTHPQFPEVDHALRFFLDHYPSAYALDRTQGTHAIRQPLDNLNEAASLYGSIIYDKAPIVMRQLEWLIGEEPMQRGLRAYLRDFAWGNAGWPDLIHILDESADLDLNQWSRVWVESAGRPTLRLFRETAADQRQFARLVQEDPYEQGRLWLQPLQPLMWSQRGVRRLELVMDQREVTLGWIIAVPSVILPNGDGLAYGLLLLPEEDQQQLLETIPLLPSALDRAVAWETLWDALLEGRLEPEVFLDALVKHLPAEQEELMIGRMLHLMRETFWGFLSAPQRVQQAVRVEGLLWDRLRSTPSDSLRTTLFRSFRDLAWTPQAVERVRGIWKAELAVKGLKLSEPDQMETALELAVRGGADARELLDQQLARLERPYSREQFTFVAEAASPEPARRRAFFASLADPEHRRREPWVLQAVSYLHHPARAGESEEFILPSLEILEEIQRTGDIFFPKRWLDATLSGHQSSSAALVVQDFLDSHPDYPPRLRSKILQSADLLFRKSRR